MCMFTASRLPTSLESGSICGTSNMFHSLLQMRKEDGSGLVERHRWLKKELGEREFEDRLGRQAFCFGSFSRSFFSFHAYQTRSPGCVSIFRVARTLLCA